MEQSLIRTERVDSGILWVTLNTPPLNLQSLDCMAALEEIVAQAVAHEARVSRGLFY